MIRVTSVFIALELALAWVLVTIERLYLKKILESTYTKEKEKQ